MRSVVTVGVFDGVHKGHAALIGKAKEIAERYRQDVSHGAARPGSQSHDGATRPGSPIRVVVIVLDPHPVSVLAPGREPARLTTFAQRERLLLEGGADAVVRTEPSIEMLSLTPRAFVEEVVKAYRPVAWVAGPDFRFGKGRAGDVETLRRLGAENPAANQSNAGFDVHVVGEEGQVEAVLTDHSIVPCRSTVVRWLVSHGRVRDAAAVLNYFYRISARVVRGDRRGRTIGYPTANLETTNLLPADGVYAGRARVEDGRTFAAAISVGTKPTFTPDAVVRTLEAYLLDAPKSADGPSIEGLAEYGWEVELEFLSYIRDQVKFDSLEGLVAQIERDCERVREIVSSKQ